MAWYRSADGGTTFHVNFGRGRAAAKNTPAPCVGPMLATDNPTIGQRCGRISVALCDFVVGRRVELGDPAGDRTCDAPVCDHHRTKMGPDLDHCWRHGKPKGGS